MRRKKLLVLAVALGLMTPLLAQKTDVTFQYIENPSFEAEQDPTTTGVSETLTGWERNYVDGYNWNGCNGDWKTDGARSYGIWKPAIDSDFELSQELTLPNGTYTLTVDMTVSKSGTTSRMNGQRMFAGDMEVFYPASAETASDNGAAYELSLTVKVTDGKLKIGIRTDGGESAGIGWFKVDNFRLYSYEGDTGYLLYCQSLLYNLANDAEILAEELPGGNAAQLLAAKNQILGDVEGSEVVAEYEDAIEALEAAIADMQPAQEVYLALRDKINVECSELKTLGYPGLTAFQTAIDAAIPTLGDPTAVVEDFEQAIADLDAAIRVYRLTEFPSATAANPVDATWLIQSPQFTKPGGDPSNKNDASREGWVYDNIPATNNEYKLNFVNGKNCWNNWNSNFTSMNVYQILEGMPAGLYSFECSQTNNGPEITDQHAYITALGGTSNSPTATYTHATDDQGGNFADVATWEPLATEKVLVGADGKLQIGFASTGNGNGSSGWFCITDCVLKYYGEGTYNEAMEKLIDQAEGLKEDAEMMQGDREAFASAIEKAKTVDTSNKEAAEEGMAALNLAIEIAETAIQKLVTFKVASYAETAAIADNEDGTYSPDLASLMGDILSEVDGVLDSNETIDAVYDEQVAKLELFLSFAEAYHAFDVYTLDLYDPDLIEIAAGVLEENLVAVAQNKNEATIKAAQKAFTETMGFCDAYDYVIEYIEEHGTEGLGELLKTELAKVQADHSAAVSAQNAILAGLAGKIYGDLEMVPGMDMTWVIVNPNFESEFDETTTGNGTVYGWNRSSTDGYNWSGCNGDWKTEGERSFGIWKPAIESNFKFWQALVVPNGHYKLTVDMTVAKDGSVSRVNGQRLFAGDYEAYYPLEAETAADNGAAYNLEVEAYVANNQLEIGIRTNGGTERGIGWFKVDDFKLTWLDNTTIGIEDVYNDTTGELVAYAENGYIVVPGADTFIVTTLNGVLVSADAQLIPGIYIVKANGKVTKVVIP